MSGYFEDSPLYLTCAVKPPPLPRIVQLEITAECNLRCVFCPLQSESRRRPSEERRLSPEDLDTHLRPVLEGAYEVELTGFGEIFCHPDLLEILRRLKRHRLAVNATSNGRHWPPECLRDIVAEKLIDLLCVSLDAGTKATYEKLRAGGVWEKVLDNLRRLQKLKRHMRLSKPVLHLSFITMRDNLAEAPLVAELAHQLGVEKVIYQGLYENAAMNDQGTAFDEREAAVFAETAAVAARYGVDLEFWYQSQPVAPAAPNVTRVQVTTPPATGRPAVRECAYPWERVFIKSNLDVQACATVWEKLVMGNLRKQSILEIWHGDGYRELRRAMASTRQPEPCLLCHTKPARPALTAVELDSEIDFGKATDRQLGPGFYQPESTPDKRRCRWTTGEAIFFMRNVEAPWLELEMAVHPAMPPTGASVSVGEQLVDVLATDNLPSLTQRLALPPFSGDILPVRLKLDAVTTPADLGEGESRRPLGLLLFHAGLRGNAHELSEKIERGAGDEQLGRGFYGPEADLPPGQRWTGERAALVLRGPGQCLELTLNVIPPLTGRPLLVFANGFAVHDGALPYRTGPYRLRIDLPLAQPWQAITLLFPKPWTPGGADRRSLGALFVGAHLRDTTGRR